MACRRLPYYHRFLYKENFSSPLKVVYRKPLREEKGYTGKYQWDFIHNPASVLFSWLEEESEGEIGSSTIIDATQLINAIRQGNIDKVEELPMKITTGYGEVNKIIFGTKDYSYFKVTTTGFNPLLDEASDEMPSYSLKPSEYSKTVFTENGIDYVKYEFHEMQTVQHGSPHADTRETTGTARIVISVKENESNKFEEYLYSTEEVLIDGVNWISQANSTFSGETCWGPPNWCCCTASKYMLSRFGVTPINGTCIAELSSPDDFTSVTPNGNFEDGLAILETYIKPREKGGEPILIGVHYPKTEDPGYRNTCTATFHYMVIIGKGYDSQKKQYYYRFYDVGRSSEADGINPQNRMYVDKQNRTLSCTYRSKTYTITEIRSNH